MAKATQLWFVCVPIVGQSELVWHHLLRPHSYNYVAIWVIPCQINKQNAFAFQISTKLGRLVPSGKLLNHTYFGCVQLYGFGVISHSFFQHFGHLAPRS